MDSSDDRVLQNSAASLTHFAQGDHSRLADVRAELKRIVENLKKKVLDLLPKRLSHPQYISQGDLLENGVEEVLEGSAYSKEKEESDAQFSLSLAVKKLSILSKRCDVSTFLGDENNFELISAISEGIKQRLAGFRDMLSMDDAEGKPNIEIFLARSIDKNFDTRHALCSDFFLSKPARQDVPWFFITRTGGTFLCSLQCIMECENHGR